MNWIRLIDHKYTLWPSNVTLESFFLFKQSNFVKMKKKNVWPTFFLLKNGNITCHLDLPWGIASDSLTAYLMNVNIWVFDLFTVTFSLFGDNIIFHLRFHYHPQIMDIHPQIRHFIRSYKTITNNSKFVDSYCISLRIKPIF